MAIELFKIYGFQPKQFEQLLKELKEGQHQIQPSQAAVASKEEKKKVGEELREAFQEKQEKAQSLEATRFGQRIDPAEKLQLLCMALAVSILGTLVAHFTINM